MKNINSEIGFSMVEMLVVIAIVAIVSVFALTQFGRTDTRFQRQNIARELKVYLERARFDSVKRRAIDVEDRAQVVITGPTSFNVTTDMNINGTIDPNDTRVMSLNGRTDARILGTNLVFPITIRFDQRGHAQAINGNNMEITPKFTICDAGCTLATANANNATVIAVTPTGTVAMMNGGEDLSNIAVPNVTTVANNANINYLVNDNRSN